MQEHGIDVSYLVLRHVAALVVPQVPRNRKPLVTSVAHETPLPPLLDAVVKEFDPVGKERSAVRAADQLFLAMGS